MEFSKGVVVRQGNEIGREAAELALGFLGDFEVVTRAVAKEDVRVQTHDAQVLPGAKGTPIGQEAGVSTCRKLDVVFRPDKTAAAGRGLGRPRRRGRPLYADLELLPGPKGLPSEDGSRPASSTSSSTVRAAGDAGGQLGTVLTSEPRTPHAGTHADRPERRHEGAAGCGQGDDEAGGFRGTVEFAQASQRAADRRPATTRSRRPFS